MLSGFLSVGRNVAAIFAKPNSDIRQKTDFHDIPNPTFRTQKGAATGRNT